MSLPDFEATEELRALAEAVADWVDDVPGISSVYLFGSRVRGDHRPDSDVDLRLYLDEWGTDNRTTEWWTRENMDDFAALKARLPGQLAIHREASDDADDAIKAARTNPVLVVRKAVCVWTPRKPHHI